MSAVSMPIPMIRAMKRTIAGGPFSAGAAVSLRRRSCSMSLICSRTMRNRIISRRSSARVFSGSGVPSAVQRPSSLSSALRSVGLKVRIRSAPALPSSGSRGVSGRRRAFRARGSAVWRLRPRSSESPPCCSGASRPATSRGRRASAAPCPHDPYAIAERAAWAVSARLRGAQWDDMADLQTTVADDDTLDDELQDRLLVGKRRLVQAGVNAITKRLQAGANDLGLDALATEVIALLLLTLQGQALVSQMAAPLRQLGQGHRAGLVGVQ